MQIPLSEKQMATFVSSKVSLATIGVCVFLRQLRLAHFLFHTGGIFYEKKACYSFIDNTHGIVWTFRFDFV